MKKEITAILSVMILCTAAGCADSSAPSSAVPAQTQATATQSDLPDYDHSLWENLYDWDEEETIGGPDPVSLRYNYNNPVCVTAKVQSWTSNGISAEVLVEYDPDESFYGEAVGYYTLTEVRKHFRQGDTVQVRFSDKTLIREESDSRYSLYTYTMPSEEYFAAGDVINLIVEQIDRDGTLYSDEILLNYYNDMSSIQATKEDIDALLEYAESEGLPPLEELPYQVAKITKWDSGEHRAHSFIADTLEQEGMTNEHNGAYYFDVSYELPNGVYGFNSPSKQEFPVGTVLKIYYTPDTFIPVYMKPEYFGD